MPEASFPGQLPIDRVPVRSHLAALFLAVVSCFRLSCLHSLSDAVKLGGAASGVASKLGKRLDQGLSGVRMSR